MLYDINVIIEEELEFIKKTLKVLKKNTKTYEGSLLVKMTSNGECYYLRSKNSPGKKRVIKKLGDAFDENVIAIKQSKYNEALIRKLEKNKALLEGMIGKFEDYDIDDVENSLSSCYVDRTGLVNKDPAFMSMEEWRRVPYKGNDVPISDDGNRAMDGRKVRSKSEVIIYDILKFYGIPFRYDVDINLENEAGQKIYKNSDFVIWSMQVEGKESTPIIWEHFGRMDDDRYFENAMHKMRLYLRNGYRAWENLFLSFDSPKGTINTYAVHRMIKDWILPRARLKESKKENGLP